MTLPGADIQDDNLYVLTRDELHFLRFTCDVYAEDESPLGPLLPMADSGVLEQAAQSLVRRGLADPHTLRPERELLRRLLITSQPDARVVLVESQPSGADRALDTYERAGALVRYRRIDDGHELGAPVELTDIRDTLLRNFNPRRSTGDFVDVTLTTTEYFAFSLFAGDLHQQILRTAEGRKPRTGRIRASTPLPEPPTRRNLSYVGREGPSVPASGLYDDDDRTPVQGLLQRLPPELADGPHVPGEEDWDAALASLVDKDIITTVGERFRLRPYFHDLAVGLASQRRHVLTRFDFCSEDWIVRDATFITVPGSLFLVRALPDRVVRVMELDDAALNASIDYVVEPIGDRSNIQFT